MDDQVVLLCDERGRFRDEYAAKEIAHSGDGLRHLAITILLYNWQGQVLLQRRKHRIFDDVWDFTAATHLLHGEDGSDETVESAATRCLLREYRLSGVETRAYGAFAYFARYGSLCENEHCTVLVAECNGGFSLNREVGYDSRWMDKARFLRDVEQHPEAYSPWAVEGVKALKADGFFD